MRTFQLSDAKSHKFWNIEVSGKSFTVTYGKIGTAGQTQTKTFANPEQAQAEADKLIKEKTKKGYVETTVKSIVSDAEAFAAAILANPRDLGPIAAYADYLTEQGDPRGEFMQIQIALENDHLTKAERQKLAKQEAALLKKHEAEWVGTWPKHVGTESYVRGIDPTGGRKYLFQRGLLTTLLLSKINVRSARAIIAAEQLQFVNHLFVGAVTYEEGEDDDNQDDEDTPPEDLSGPDIPEGATTQLGQYPLLRWPQLKHIRYFGWGWIANEDYDDFAGYSCHMPGDHVYDFIKQMPAIEELHIYAHVRDANKIVTQTMPNLRVFKLYHSWSYPLDKLANNPSLTNLQEIHCHPHGLEYDDKPYIRLGDLKAICRSPYMKSLTHLRLKLSDVGDAGAKELVESGILKRLKFLDLRHGCMSDRGAELLAACPDITHLEHLDLSLNALTDQGIKALKKTGVHLIAKNMHDETRYDSDDENAFLWDGDPE